MLEQMRRQGASIFVYLIFCLLILIFVINFRPGQSRQDDNGCRGVSNSVLSVDGVDAPLNAFKVAYSGNGASGKEKAHIAMEVLIRRELLAQAGEARGLMVTDELVMDAIKHGHFFFAGQTVDIPHIFDDPDGERVWNLRAFEAWYGQLNVTRNSYIEEQKRGMMAAMMADILKESVSVSREEALSQFLFEGNTAQYDVVAFKPETYRSALEITDEDVDRFVASHGDDIAARYKADERLYKATKPALQLRQIFIVKKSDDPKSPGMTIDDAKAKLEAVKKDGAPKFAKAAKELSTDPAAKAASGELGWHTADAAMLGEKAVTDAVKTLKPGEMTPVIATDKGVYLVLAEDKREGDLKLDQVKREIALGLAKDTWSKEAAKRAAISALDHARNGMGQNLDQLYKAEEAPAQQQLDPEQIEQLLQQQQNMTPEQKQQFRQMIQQQQQQHAPAHGMLEVESKDQPAGWLADDSAAAGSAAVGSAGSATGAGSGDGAGSGTVVAAPKPATVVASKDVLPALADVAAPMLNHYGPTPREKQLPGLGSSKEAIAAVFDELSPGNLAKQVYEADGAYAVIQMVSRQTPNVTDFDKDADRRVARLRATRAEAFLNGWLKDRCEALAKDNKIRPALDKLTERDDQGRPLPITYRPCYTFR